MGSRAAGGRRGRGHLLLTLLGGGHPEDSTRLEALKAAADIVVGGLASRTLPGIAGAHPEAPEPGSAHEWTTPPVGRLGWRAWSTQSTSQTSWATPRWSS